MTRPDALDRVDFEQMFDRLTDAIGGPDALRRTYRELDFEIWGLTLAETFRTPGAASVVGMLLISAAVAEREHAALAARVADLEHQLFLKRQPYDQRSVSDMIAWMARDMSISATSIRTDRRKTEAATARQAIAWAARKIFNASYPRLGRALGDLDHSTIIHHVRRAETRRELDPDFRALTDRLIAAFERKAQ